VVVTGAFILRRALLFGGLAMLPAGVFPRCQAQGVSRVDQVIPRALDQFPGIPSIREIAPRPSGNGAYGNLVSPPGALRPNMRFATGALHTNMDRAIGLNALMLPETQGSDRSVTTASHRAIANGVDLFDVGGNPAAATPSPAPPSGGIRPGCSDNQTERGLQAGGQFWNSQAGSVVPAQFPRDVFTANARGNADPLALGPAGHPVNLPAAGPAGGWCRPPGVPMSQSSPLSRRGFWILVIFPSLVVLVFWLTRGFRLQPTPQAES